MTLQLRSTLWLIRRIVVAGFIFTLLLAGVMLFFDAKATANQLGLLSFILLSAGIATAWIDVAIKKR